MNRTAVVKIVVVGVIAGVIGCQVMAPQRLQAQAADVSWEEPQPLGEHLYSSWFPEIDTDPYGTVRAVWESTRDLEEPRVDEANGGAIMISELRDGQWTEPNDIYIKDALNAARPILASDETYLHLISRSPRAEGRISIRELSGIYYMRAPLNRDVTDPRSWSQATRLTNGAAYWAQLVTLPEGRLVLAYNQVVQKTAAQRSEDGEDNQLTALFVRVSNDYGATWERPVRLSFTESRVARNSLVVSPGDGTLILSWDEGYDNMSGKGTPAGIFTATSSDSGTTWAVEGQLDPVAPGERAQSHAGLGGAEMNTLVATDELTMLVYRATSEDVILYRISQDQGRSWSEEMAIPRAIPIPFRGSHHFDKYSLVADSDGRIIFAYVGQNPNAPAGLSIFAMSYYEDEWSAPAVVASPSGLPEYPRLTIVRGNELKLAFFVRDVLSSEEGHYVIWTASGVTPAQPIAAPQPPERIEHPTPAPAPTRSDDESSAGAIDIAAFPSPADSVIPDRSETDAEPTSTITGPISMAALLTACLLIVAAISFKILNKLTSLG